MMCIIPVVVVAIAAVSETVRSEGNPCSSLYFNGSACLHMPGTRLVGDHSVTVEAWIILSGQSYWGGIAAQMSDGSTAVVGDFVLRITPAGELEWFRRTSPNSSWVFVVGSTSTIPFNQWTHVAGVYDESDPVHPMRVYINGIRVPLGRNSPNDGYGDGGSLQGQFTVGAAEQFNWFFPGSIDEVRVWNIARSDAELLETALGLACSDQLGLVAEFGFNEGSGTETRESVSGSEATFSGPVQWQAICPPASQSVCRCVGDISGDDRTTSLDFNLLAAWFGESVPVRSNGDLNGDGTVNALDFNILANDFGCGL